MNRKPLSTLLAATILVVLSIVGSGAAIAQPSAGVADAAIIGTNSVDLDRNVTVAGDVVVNAASAGPTLDGGVELNVDKVNTLGIRTAEGDLKADSVTLNKFAAISGTVFYNELFDEGATVGGLFTPLPLPVFAQLPAFQNATVHPGAPDVLLGAAESDTLDEGDWGDIDVGAGATLTLTGGIYNVRSITVGQDANLFFEGGADIRIVGRLATGKNSTVGAAPDETVFPSQIILYVGGINGTGGGLLEPPLAAAIGRESTFDANVYAAHGTISIGRLTLATGGFIARDVWVQTGASVTVDSFVNRPPTADPQAVFTAGAASIDIVLTGSDPNGDPLSFSVASLPTTGVLTDSNDDPVVVGATLPSPTVTFTPGDPEANSEDSFDFTVTDPGLLTDTATVQINPAGDPVVQCTQNSDCDPGQFCNTGAGLCQLGEVVATNRLCASAVDPIDCSLETITDTAVIIRLRGTAPCDPTGAPNPAEPCDGVGNDAPLTFALPSSTTSQGGTLSGLAQGTGVPRRSAAVLYTPPEGFTGVDSFSFDVSGDVDGSGGIDPSGEPNPEIDSGSIEISVQTFTPTPQVEARDQRVSTPMNTPVTIALSGGAGSCDPLDPDCRTGTPLTAPSMAGQIATAPQVAATLSSSATAEILAKRQALAKSAAAARSASRFAPQTLASSADLAAAMDIPASLIASSNVTGDPVARDARSNLGVILPTRGSQLAVLSTGVVGTTAQFGTDLGATGADGDETVLTLVLNVPAGNGLLSFDYNFLTAEYPEFVGSIFNDTFTVTLTDKLGGPRVIETAQVNFANLLDVTPNNAGGTGFDIFDGSGAADAGLTGIIRAIEPFVSDGQITLEFSIKDVGDGIYDSAVILDNVDLELQDVGFTLLSLPEFGALSYVNPVTPDSQITITAADLPLLLPTEQLIYTPPTGQTGDPIASFNYQLSDGLTTDTGLIELVVTGAIIVVDSCTAVGRPPGCEAEAAGAGDDGVIYADSDARQPAARTPNLRVVVEGKGTVTSSRRETRAGSFVGLSCSGDCGAEFTAGTEVVLYARTLENSVFVGWGGDCSGSEPITTVTVGRRTVCVAVFETPE